MTEIPDKPEVEDEFAPLRRQVEQITRDANDRLQRVVHKAATRIRALNAYMNRRITGDAKRIIGEEFSRPELIAEGKQQRERAEFVFDRLQHTDKMQGFPPPNGVQAFHAAEELRAWPHTPDEFASMGEYLDHVASGARTHKKKPIVPAADAPANDRKR